MKSNGILFFTDFHAHLFMEFAKHDDEYYTDRFKEQCAVLEHILATAAKNKYILVFGGDLFHKRGAVDVRVFNKVYALFQKYAQQIPDTYLLRGNHDSYDNSMGSESSLDTFTALGIHVVSKPEEVLTDLTVNDKPVQLNFMPYGEEIKDMKAELKAQADKLVDDHMNLLVAHLGIDGAKQGLSTHPLASAFSLSDMYPDKYSYVYLGHYHLRQHLADNVWYGGSTMQLSFSDEGQEKGYDVLHTDGTWEFVPLNDMNHQFVTVKGLDNIKDLNKETNYIRLRVSENDVKKMDEAKEFGEDVPANIRVEAQVENAVDARLDITADDSPASVVGKFTDEFYPDMKQLALDVLKEATEND